MLALDVDVFRVSFSFHFQDMMINWLPGSTLSVIGGCIVLVDFTPVSLKTVGSFVYELSARL